MSKLSEYSKFDHIDTDDSDDNDDDNPKSAVTTSTITTTQPQPQSQRQPQSLFRRKPGSNTRFLFEHDGRIIYEWEQTLDEVILYVPTPPVVTRASQLICLIHPNQLQIGLRQQQKQQQQQQQKPPANTAATFFLNESTFGTVDVASSTWTFADGVLTVELQKAHKGVVWEAVCRGATGALLNPFQMEEEKQRLMLERWQQENPGMDFRDATFNGSVPDPRSFMGGVRYD